MTGTRFLLFLLFVPNFISAQIQFGSANILTSNEMELIFFEDGFPADIDQDGDVDIVTVSNHLLSWFENLDGKGLFGPPQLISNRAVSSLSVYAFDVDNDGGMDVLTTAIEDETVSWYRNLNGKGVFGDRQVITDTLRDPSEISFVDMNMDGIQDLLVTGYFQIAWFENLDSLGYFGKANFINTGQSIDDANSVFAVDFDRDNDVDILVSQFLDEKIVWFENKDSTFTQRIIQDSVLFANAVLASDVDGDGDQDVIATLEGGQLAWYENTQDSLQFSPAKMIEANAGWASRITTADVDQDGNMDLIAVRLDEVFWHKNLGGGNFAPEIIIDREEDQVRKLNTADIDGDGDLDIIAFSWSGGEASWYENEDGLGSFGRQQQFNPTQFSIRNIDIVDLDGDNDLDIIAGNSNQGKLFWMENEQGVFSHHQLYADARGVTGYQAGDLDADGDLDIVSVDNSKILWFENLDGNGKFSDAIVVSDSISETNRVFIEDVNGDGDLDIIFCARTGVAGWYRNLGDATFADFFQFGFPFFGTKTMEVCDLDGDGDLDMIGVDHLGTRAVWFENEDGQGMISQKRSMSLTTMDEGAGVWPADVDGDGDLDILHADPLGWIENVNDFSIFLESNTIDENSFRTSDIYTKDLDNDGDLDVITTLSTGPIVWYENLDGAGQFTEAQQIADSKNGNYEILIDDMDNDGDLDIVTASGALIWIQNEKYDTKLSGICFFDENENKVKDPNEIGLLNHIMYLDPIGVNRFTDSNGEFLFSVVPGRFNLSGILDDRWELSTDSMSYSILMENMKIDNLDFGLKPKEIITEIGLSQAYSPTRCGFTIPFWISYQNTGTTFANGELEFELDPLIAFVSSDSVPIRVEGNKYFWEIKDLGPSYTQTIQLELRMPSVDFIGEVVGLTSRVLLEENGSLVEHILKTDSSVINCAYDPNDKLVLPVGVEEAHYTIIGNELEYTIRFQNTGTDTAFNVEIRDHLDPALAWASFRPMAASHPYEASLFDYGRVVFDFKNIMLPDSNTNLIESQGFVTFRIKHQDNILENTAIRNKANIFFDFNPAIETNTTLNTFVTEIPVSIPNPAFDLGLTVYPNPFDNYLIFRLDEDVEDRNLEINIYDFHGRLIKQANFNHSKVLSMDQMEWKDGIYYYTVMNRMHQIKASGILLNQ